MTTTWEEQVQRTQYPPEYNGECMFCVETGSEGHEGHAVTAERWLEETCNAFWMLVDAIGLEDALTTRPSMEWLVELKQHDAG